MNVNTRKNLAEIGGYFGLEMPEYPLPFEPMYRYQSARAGFHAVLAASGFKRVYIPLYICDSIILAAQNAGLETELYHLNEKFLPEDVPSVLPSDTCLIYVNYFGMGANFIKLVLDRYPVSQVIIDQSQAFFAKTSRALAEIYSPRKFVGLPDGGLVCTTLDLPTPSQEDDGSIDRLRHLFRRFAYSARAGYEDFNNARLSLADTEPKSMSRLTRRMLHTIQWQQVAERRYSNCYTLSEAFSHDNEMAWPLHINDAPLCYPYVRRGIDMAPIRKRLAQDHDIFTAVYWPEVIGRAKKDSTEELMTKNTLFLPIDQRMTKEHTAHVIYTVRQLLNESETCS